MSGSNVPKPSPSAPEWTLDLQRHRLINPKFFSKDTQVLYEPNLFQAKLRPDLTKFSEGVFNRKVNAMHELKLFILSHMQREFQRYKLYSAQHDFQGQKVA